MVVHVPLKPDLTMRCGAVGRGYGHARDRRVASGAGHADQGFARTACKLQVHGPTAPKPLGFERGARVNLLPVLARLPFFIGLWCRFPYGSVATRVDYGIFARPHYAYGVYWSALQAKLLGHRRISVMEFGVAGGRGLLALEAISAEVERALDIEIDVFGFDSGTGMPAPVDYRDLPHIWGQGFYRMDRAALEARLARAQLVLGDVRETVPLWLAGADRAPLAFVAFDLDYYSSTVDALGIFSGTQAQRLPRVYCYFDDVASNNLGAMNPHVGELLAIEEFNARGATRKICRVEQLRLNRKRWENWQERIYVHHDFQHAQYATLLIPRDGRGDQLPL
jgi:hypothetical protein